jgi:hypothetical protein
LAPLVTGANDCGSEGKAKLLRKGRGLLSKQPGKTKVTLASCRYASVNKQITKENSYHETGPMSKITAVSGGN